LIAQAEENPFQVGPEQQRAQDARAFGGEDVEQRKAQAEQDAKAYLDAEYWGKQQLEGQ